MLIPNITEFLSENWAIMLYHEWFSEFRHLSKKNILQHASVQSIIERVSIRARQGLYLDKEYYEELKEQVDPEIVKTIQVLPAFAANLLARHARLHQAEPEPSPDVLRPEAARGDRDLTSPSFVSLIFNMQTTRTQSLDI